MKNPHILNIIFFFFLTLIFPLIGMIEVVPEKEINLPPMSKKEEKIDLRIIFPRPGENKRRNPLNVQMRVKNFSLGLQPFEEKSVRIIIDHEPYFSIYQAANTPYEHEPLSNDQLISFALPFNLSKGQHCIRSFLCFFDGKSLKEAGCFATRIFSFQDRKKSDPLHFDISGSYLTYNEPQGKFSFHPLKPLLLDFYLTHCTLSPQGYKVRLSINKTFTKLLTKWVSYYIYGLKKGTHHITLELLDPKNQPVSGSFSYAEKKIIIE